MTQDLQHIHLLNFKKLFDAILCHLVDDVLVLIKDLSLKSLYSKSILHLYSIDNGFKSKDSTNYYLGFG
jgi:hypothetical protein